MDKEIGVYQIFKGYALVFMYWTTKNQKNYICATNKEWSIIWEQWNEYK